MKIQAMTREQLIAEMVEGILKSADNALYRAKNEGRDRVVVSAISS